MSFLTVTFILYRIKTGRYEMMIKKLGCCKKHTKRTKKPKRKSMLQNHYFSSARSPYLRSLFQPVQAFTWRNGLARQWAIKTPGSNYQCCHTRLLFWQIKIKSEQTTVLKQGERFHKSGGHCGKSFMSFSFF